MARQNKIKAYEYDFSVIIPVFNAEKTIKQILKKISEYAAHYNIEVIVLDSESSDKTSEITKKYKETINLRYKVIKKKEFNYGNTRNIGIQLAKGKYICFLSKSAIPANNIFKYFKEDFKKFPQCAAVFGQQIPAKNINVFQKLELVSQFKELNAYTNSKGIFIQNIQTFPKNAAMREQYLWYSLFNPFACYKRSFLLQHPFPTIDYGEDLYIGKKIIDLGLTKLYDIRPCVTYEKPYTLYEYYQRQRIDYLSKKNLLGRPSIHFFYKLNLLFHLKNSFQEKIACLLSFPIYYFLKFLVYFEFRLLK